jgi:hypothetical protein
MNSDLDPIGPLDWEPESRCVFWVPARIWCTTRREMASAPADDFRTFLLNPDIFELTLSAV